MNLLIKNGGHAFSKIGFNVFYVIMNGLPIITNCKSRIYLIKLILYENDIKLWEFSRSPDL